MSDVRAYKAHQNTFGSGFGLIENGLGCSLKMGYGPHRGLDENGLNNPQQIWVGSENGPNHRP